MIEFDDGRLDDPAALDRADDLLRRLAGAGARVRTEAEAAASQRSVLADLPRPRAVIAAGTEARLIRALLEPICPVPFLAWPRHGLPAWVGALDLVVVNACDGGSDDLMATVRETLRRGATLMIACPPGSEIAELAQKRASIVLPTVTGDALAAVVIALAGLHDAGLGPSTVPEGVADAMDEVATACSPHATIADNPAKDVAIGLADSQPLVWGGSVLAARASRRIAEAIRANTGRAALAADASELAPVISAVGRRDPFADPFADDAPAQRRPVLLVVDDGSPDEHVQRAADRLRAAAERHDVRVCRVFAGIGTELERYVSVLQTGLYAAGYLAVGLDSLEPPE